MDDLEAIRARLSARKDDCWARLEDVVSELWALHEVHESEILRRVRTTIVSERREAEEPGCATS
jgi:hypothetical protein